MRRSTSSARFAGTAPSHDESSLTPAWRRFLDMHRHSLAKHGGWELRFARDVLSRVSGLTPDMVDPQHPFRDDNGRQRYIDFAIMEGSCARGNPVLIAVEVDGYDKTGTGAGPTPAAMADWFARQNALTRQGWRVLRFLNSTFASDPVGAARTIAATLADARTAAAVPAARHAGDTESATLATDARVEHVGPTWKRYRVLTATTILATALLVVGLLPLPSAYYVLLRWMVTGAAIMGVIQCATRRVSWAPVALLLVAAVYNPVVPLYLGSRQLWRVINLITAAVILSAAEAVTFGDSLGQR